MGRSPEAKDPASPLTVGPGHPGGSREIRRTEGYVWGLGAPEGASSVHMRGPPRPRLGLPFPGTSEAHGACREVDAHARAPHKPRVGMRCHLCGSGQGVMPQVTPRFATKKATEERHPTGRGCSGGALLMRERGPARIARPGPVTLRTPIGGASWVCQQALPCTRASS